MEKKKIRLSRQRMKIRAVTAEKDRKIIKKGKIYSIRCVTKAIFNRTTGCWVLEGGKKGAIRRHKIVFEISTKSDEP
jgi:hypothetical protein